MFPGHRLCLFLSALLLCSRCMIALVQLCPNCGSTQVPYPLSTAFTCGDPSYKVRCVSDTLLFDTLNSSYTIQSINPQAQRLVIQPADFIGNTCVTTDFPDQGVQLNTTLPFNITSDNTILYLNCSQSLLNSPLNCSSSSLCHTYVNSTTNVGVASCRSEPICCTFKTGGSVTSYSIRVRSSGCKAYRSFVNLNQALPIESWGPPGIEIQWIPPQESVCSSQSDCGDGSNSTCGPDPAMPGISRCYCITGWHWDSVNGVCAEDSKCINQGDSGCNGSKDRTPLIAGLTSGLGTALVACSVAFLAYRRYRRIKEARDRLTREREEILNAGGGKSAKIFSGKEIKKATNGFSRDRLLGVGGYGEVYKGIIDDGTIVAIKCAKLGNAKGTDQVLNEVRILCQVNHRSLVRLLGCCVELEQPLLVYEYIPNGTLYEHLQRSRESKGLTWIHRLRIAHDTAEGLTYLHSSAVPPIYHRDVKSSNILLDEKLNAKVSDFGLSRLAETDMSHISTCAQGTLGYLDPEYYRNYQLTDKSDVYSFGVVLLELLTSQKAIDFNRDADDVNLAIYVQRVVSEDKLMEAVDEVIKKGASEVEVDTMKALGFLAVSCLEEHRQNRPSMKEVVEEIDYIMSIATSTATQ